MKEKLPDTIPQYCYVVTTFNKALNKKLYYVKQSYSNGFNEKPQLIIDQYSKDLSVKKYKLVPVD